MNPQNSETSSIECSTSVIKNNKFQLYDDDYLGPLPKNWERSETEQGEIYFIDHNTGSSHWLDPRMSRFQKKSLEDCGDDELPFGWDVVYDPQYGTYYIDHVNRKTQYENPVIQAKRLAEQARLTKESIYENHFTKDLSKLIGERIVTKIMKSPKGFGFTIIGGDDSNSEFLQIKNILPNGPAWNDGKLKIGDVLVNVCGTCVLGFSHHEMINIFQSIMPDGYATIEVCRGYALPPEDPTNTDVITIVAVDGQSFDTMHENNYANNMDVNMFEILDLKIFKDESFGFTIADGMQGQKVKKLLDSKTCKNVFEGDILLTINGINVKEMGHSQVVEVLKSCPKSSETSIKVLRSKYSSRYGKFKEIIRDNNRYGVEQSLYRSKTPTADLYSTEPKTILPIRSKTPSGDNRSPIVTPLNDIKITELDKKEIKDHIFLEHDLLENNNSSHVNAISDLTNRFNQLDMENNIYESKSHFLKTAKQYANTASGGSNCLDINPESIYSITSNCYEPTIPNQYTNNEYSHENCFCYDCQVFTGRKHSQSSNYFTLPPQMNDNVGKRLNQFMNERRFNNVQETQNKVNNQWEWHQPAQNLFKNQDGYMVVITLERQATGFGFRIVGGTEEASPITVGHIVPGGAADLHGRIRTGDEIIFINGICLKNTSHHHVVQLMTKAADRGIVRITLKRRFHYPYDVFVTRHENEGFGFVIISSSSQTYGSIIGKLIPGSPAEKSGELKIGDLIVAVNGINIIGMSHGQVVNIIKESGLQVQLTIENTSENSLIDAQFRENMKYNSTINHFPIVC